jgi:alpha-aminoadipate carrier protein LysW
MTRLRSIVAGRVVYDAGREHGKRSGESKTMIRDIGRARMAVCPECEADIELDEYDVDKGEIISCPECGVDLEVVGLSPLELDVAPQEEDDWEE